MHPAVRALAPFAFAMAIAGCGQPPPPAGDGAADTRTRAAIEAANQATVESVKRGDPAAIVAHYADDALLLPAGSGTVSGPAAIEDHFRNAIAAGLASLDLEILTLDAAGDLAIETGTYEARDAAGNRLDYGKYVVAWRHVDGNWKAYRDIATTSRPDVTGTPAAAPAASCPEAGNAVPATS